jgi:hypothetical protein
MGCTRMYSGAWRAPWCPPGAARVARRGGRREGAAAALWRGRHDDVVHRRPNKQHQEAPYLTAKLRSGTKESERRRRRGSTQRHSTGRWRRGEPRVWWQMAALGLRSSAAQVGALNRGAASWPAGPRAWDANAESGSAPSATPARMRVQPAAGG